MAKITDVNEQKTASYVVNWLKTNGGMTIQGACGVAGNIEAESHFKTGADGDGGTSKGICQWHNERFDELVRFAGNRDWKNLDVQLEYIMQDMKSKSYSDLYNVLKTTTSPTDASTKWGHDYERFANFENYSTETYLKRASYAEAIYSGVTTGGWEAADMTSVMNGSSSSASSGTVAGNLLGSSYNSSKYTNGTGTFTGTEWGKPIDGGTISAADYFVSAVKGGKEGNVIVGTHIKQQ